MNRDDKWVKTRARHRYLSTPLFASLREECENMELDQRVLLSDQAGRQFYVPPLKG